MIYPVGNGTKGDFEKNWYIASGFGENRGTYYHEGVDINLKTGGDTDLGQEIKAIANGKMVYYHFSSHPTTGFGRHNVYKIDGAWGTRWIMNAHMGEQDFIKEVKDINQGTIIGRIGKSGTVYAHDHMSIFKVDPVSVGGIDNIANTSNELYAVWEDPIAFIDKWMQPTQPQPPVNDQTQFDFGSPWGTIELQQARGIMNDQKRDIEQLRAKIESAKQVLS